MKTLIAILAGIAALLITQAAEAPRTMGAYPSSSIVAWPPGPRFQGDVGMLSGTATNNFSVGNDLTVTGVTYLDLLSLDGFNMNPLTNLLGGVVYLEQWGAIDPATFTAVPSGTMVATGSSSTGAVFKASGTDVTNAVPSGVIIDGSDFLSAPGGLGTTDNPNIDDVLQALGLNIIGLGDALTSFQEDNQTIIAQWGFENLHVIKAPTTTVTTNTGTSFAYDWDGAGIQLNFVQGNATRVAVNAPTGSFGRWGPVEILISDAPTNCTISQIDGHILFGRLTVGGIVPTVVQVDTVIFYQPFYTPFRTWFFWKGNQDQPLSPLLGGSGRTNLAQTIVWPTATTSGGSNSYNIDLDGGAVKEFRIASSLPIYINASSGRSTHTNDAVTARVRTYNSGSVTNSQTFRSDYNLVGFTNHTTYLEPGQYGLWEHSSEGPSETNTWVYNYLATVQTLVSGGTPPSSTLPDGLVGLWKLNETSGSSTADEIGSNDLGEYGTAWTKNFTLVGSPNTTPAWTNTTYTSTLTNGAAALNLGRSGADMTAALIFAPFTFSGTRGVMGEWEEVTGNNRSWRVRIGTDGKATFTVSSTGTAASASVISTSALSLNTRSLIVVALDQTANLIKVSINGGTFATSSFSSNLYDGAAPFAVGGTGESSAYIANPGAYDQPALWNRLLSQSEVDELWNGGDILDLSTL